MNSMKYFLKLTSRWVIFNKQLSSNHKKTFNRFLCSGSAPEDFENVENLKKVLKVAVLGTPNAGKSTLINRILERPLCPTSSKVHTTKELARVACHIGETQIVFLDTPGLITSHEKKKYTLPNEMVHACHQGRKKADLLAVLYDARTRCTPCLPPVVIPYLTPEIPTVLILNKVDRIKSKQFLLDLTRILTGNTVGKYTSRSPSMLGPQLEEKYLFTDRNRGYKGFAEVFFISALNGDGVDELIEYFVKNAKPMNHIKPAPPLDMKPEKFILNTIRAILMDMLPNEVPYKLRPEMELYEEHNDGRIVTAVRIVCPSARIARLLVGPGGIRLHAIRVRARDDLTRAFGALVSVVLQTVPAVINATNEVVVTNEEPVVKEEINLRLS